MTKRATKRPIKSTKSEAARRAKTRRRGRRPKYEQTVPMVLGRHREVEPVKVRVRPLWVLVALVVIVIVALALTVALSPRFRVAEPQVTGASHIAVEEIVRASGLAQLHILGVNERRAAAYILEQLPSIERAEVDCRLPADCTIAVNERLLLLTWESESGPVWVDAAGGAFPASGPLEGRWLVQGPLATDAQGRVDQEVLLGLAELTQLGIRPGSVTYRPGRGLVLDDPAGWRVVVGQGWGMARRLQVYAAVREHLLEQSIQPLFVDVRFPDAPYYSVSNEW